MPVIHTCDDGLIYPATLADNLPNSTWDCLTEDDAVRIATGIVANHAETTRAVYAGEWLRRDGEPAQLMEIASRLPRTSGRLQRTPEALA